MSDATVRRPISWRSACETDIGVVRSMNEDAVLMNTDAGIWGVADGMGGHEAGNIASNMIVEALQQVTEMPGLNDVVNLVEEKVIDVNQRLLEYSEIMLDGRIVGSTFVALIIRDRIGVCMWAGDSRLYRFRSDQLTQISFDHSLVTELLKQGSITADEMENHPESNVITRAVGTSDELFVDIDVFDVQLGDTFLLCSDGLYNAVDEESMTTVLRTNEIKNSTQALIQAALDNEASDNVSVVLVKGVPSAA